MHDHVTDWEHPHTFGQEVRRPGERRTVAVIVITATMMVVEIVAGLLFASMALLADGLHMASHTVALGIAAAAYMYARRHAHDPEFSFGTGKVNALGGFTGALLLGVFAVLMAAGSVERLIDPAQIAIDSAILVAVLGLIVNGVCVAILNTGGDAHGGRHDHDHNLRAAYLHVLADALTSILAIFALLSAKYLGLTWMDPVMGIVGALLVARWALGLLRATGAVLVDQRGPRHIRHQVVAAIERDGDSRVAELHLWSIAPGVYAAEITVVADSPETASGYKARIPAALGVEHVCVEVHRCTADEVDQACLIEPAATGAEAGGRRGRGELDFIV